MHVLIITHIFWPETADYKNLLLARELIKRGHEVTVLTAFPNYPLGRLYDGYKMSWRQWEHIDGVRVLRVPLYPDHSSSGLKRILNYGTFTLSVSTIGLMLAGKPDVIFVHAPPMTLGIAASIFKTIYKAPILLDVVDLWPDALAGSGMVSSKIIIKGSGAIANAAYLLADKITTPTEGFASRIHLSGVPKHKISIIPNWADRTIYTPAEKSRSFGEQYNLEGKFCIIHAGNVGPYQGIDNILRAAELLQDIDLLRILLVGGGKDLERLKRLKSDLNLDNVIFTGTYPADEMSGIFAWANALLVSLKSDPYLDINLPSKLPAYMASGRPIIACAEGETSRIVTDNRLGISCKPGDPEALANSIIYFMSLSEQECHEMGQRGSQLYDISYDKDVLIGSYVKMLEAMV